MSNDPSLPSPEQTQVGLDRLKGMLQQASQSLFHEHIIIYESQKPSILGTVDPDELERLAGEKLNKGTHRMRPAVFMPLRRMLW
jgi:hypothetical protein